MLSLEDVLRTALTRHVISHHFEKPMATAVNFFKNFNNSRRHKGHGNTEGNISYVFKRPQKIENFIN